MSQNWTFGKIGPFEFLERFRCYISSVSIYYAPESDIHVKSYDHMNYTRGSVVQFQTSRYNKSLNRTFMWIVMTIGISREPPLFNFERLDILCVWIGHPCEKVWPFEFLERFRCSILSVWIHYAPESDTRVKTYDHLNFSKASVVQFRASRYIMRWNRTSVWKVITIWISREVQLFNFERLDILSPLIRTPCENLWPLEFLESIRCSIASVSIYYIPESYIRVKSYGIWISRKVPLFNFERRDILCARMGHPCKKLWPFEFLENFRC